jgi:pilus assembly protein CpaB
MNARRLVIALLIALLLSGGMTFFISRKLSNRNIARPQTRRYVAASRPVQAGEVLKADNLTLVDWPDAVPVQGGFKKPEELVGRSIIFPVASGQPILDAYLAAPGSGIGLTVKIPEGMRATSVKSDEVVGVAGFLFPGSHVDVLVTFRSDKAATPVTATQIVLQDVEVLTTGQNFEPDPQGKAQSTNVVTLLLTPQDAQKVVLAASQGTIQLVLRNGADRGRVNPVPIEVSALSGPETPHPTGGSATPRTSNNHGYVVETIIGDKHSTARFE